MNVLSRFETPPAPVIRLDPDVWLAKILSTSAVEQPTSSVALSLLLGVIPPKPLPIAMGASFP